MIISSSPAAARGVVVSAAGPQMRSALHELALPTFERYAARWDLDVRVVDLPVDGTGADTAAQAAKWAKVGVLREALRSHGFALWLDADVLLLRDDEDIRTRLRPGHFQALALEQVPQEHRVNPNTGVWLMRSCPEALAFLDAVLAAGQQPGPWADQGAVLAALGWDRGDEHYVGARPGRGTSYLRGTSWLPPGWNQPYLGPRTSAEVFTSAVASYEGRPCVPAPHALHFMGLRPAARYRHMAAAAAAAESRVAGTALPVGVPG